MLKQLPRHIKTIEAKAKKGSYGIWRREFCKKYPELLNRSRNNAYNSLVETLALNGGMVTCRKGCVHCCFHYVALSVAHGLVIVDYLYKRKELLKQFLENHKKWQGKGYTVANSIDRTRNQALSSSTPIDRVIAETRPMSECYLDMNIPCPFLAGGECFIYEVRPLSCSGHYSISPPEWCASGSRQKPVIHHISPRDEDLVEMLRLSDPRLLLYELALPTMVHRLLTESSSAVVAEIA